MVDRLSLLEQRIERNVQDVGAALAEIRDQRLYRAQYATFEDYCRERWGWARGYAYRMIQASEVQAMLPNGNSVTEGVARELAPLRQEPEAMQAAWEEAQQVAAPTGKPPTAAIVRQVVRGDVVQVPDATGSGDVLVRTMNVIDDLRRLPRGELLAVLRNEDRLVLVNVALNARWLMELVQALDGDKRLEVVK